MRMSDSSRPPLLQSVVVETGPKPCHGVLWLHGLGADGHDFEPIVPELVAPSWPALRFVFPHAPIRPVTINGGMRMRAWYDIVGLDIAARSDEAGIRASIGLVETLIAEQAAHGIAPERLLLAGFSQGAAIALSAGLRHRHRLAGIIALSGYLPLHEALSREASEANRATPLFIAHGRYDPVVPIGLGEQSRDRLRALGYRVDWYSYPMQHAVSPQQIQDLRDWIGRRLGA